MQTKNRLILIAGGTASGKTVTADKVTKSLNEKGVSTTTFRLDNYYKEWKDLGVEYEKRNSANWDHPDSFQWDEIEKDVTKLLNNKEVVRKIFNYEECAYLEDTITIKPAKYIIIEGLYALYDTKLNDIAWASFFISANEQVRKERRIERDGKKRHANTWNLEEFNIRWDTLIQPMHDKFIEPTKEKAEIIINNNENNEPKAGNAVKTILNIIK